MKTVMVLVFTDRFRPFSSLRTAVLSYTVLGEEGKRKQFAKRKKKGNQHEHPNHKRPSHIKLHEAHSLFLGIQPGPNIVDKLCTSLIVH
jgi:hypothetical protein